MRHLFHKTLKHGKAKMFCFCLPHLLCISGVSKLVKQSQIPGRSNIFSLQVSHHEIYPKSRGGPPLFLYFKSPPQLCHPLPPFTAIYYPSLKSVLDFPPVIFQSIQFPWSTAPPNIDGSWSSLQFLISILISDLFSLHFY